MNIETSDSHVVSSATEENRQKFETLYQECSDEVWAAAYAECSDGDSATTCMEEAFTMLWDIPRIRGDVVMWLRETARRLAAEKGMDGGGQSSEKPQADRRFHIIRETLALETVRDRELLTLCFGLKRTPEQIADRLGMTVPKVEARLDVLRQRLRDSLEATGQSV